MKAFDRFQMEQLDEPLQGGGGTQLNVQSVDVRPSPVTPGPTASFTITVALVNLTETKQTGSFDVLQDGSRIGTVSATVPPRTAEQRQVITPVRVKGQNVTRDEITISVGGKSETVQVRPPDTNQDQDQDQQQETDRSEGGGGSGDAVETVSLDDRRIQTTFEITAEQPVVGQQAQTLFEITNNADQRLRVRDTFTVNGSAIGSVDTVLTPSETVQRTPTFTVPDATEIALSARSLDAENTARTIPAVSIASIDAQPLTPTAGDQVMVTVGVENRTRSQATQALTVRVDGTSTQGTTVTIPAGGTVRKQFTHTFQQAGEHTISVNKATATIQVQEPPSEPQPSPEPEPEPEPQPEPEPEPQPQPEPEPEPEPVGPTVPSVEEAGGAVVAGAAGLLLLLVFVLGS